MARKKVDRLRTCPQCRQPIAGVAVRGVCWACFKDPNRRPAPSFDGKNARRSGDVRRQGRVPADSTPFLPGTAEKVRVMEWRASRGESCFHPDDARPDADENLKGFDTYESEGDDAD